MTDVLTVAAIMGAGRIQAARDATRLAGENIPAHSPTMDLAIPVLPDVDLVVGGFSLAVIGERIRTLREEKRWTNGDLARGSRLRQLADRIDPMQVRQEAGSENI